MSGPNFQYILYKHGPYSFDLTADLTAACGRLSHGTQSSLSWLRSRLGSHSDEHGASQLFPESPGINRPRLSTFAKAFGARGVANLKKLANVLFVAEMGETSDPLQRASRIHELKLPCERIGGLAALQEFYRIAHDAQSLTPDDKNRDDKRLIEDYLPIDAISAEASREKSVRKGHIYVLHLWWARRPLVACRAAVYGALVPAPVRAERGERREEEILGRANAAKFVERLCLYPGDPKVIAEAQRHILEAHAERLTQETGKTVTVGGHRGRPCATPKVLDMFAGGGAIPLEALRLGCEAYALDLNPVAHIIQLCTLVYPQKYGKPDSTARGMTGPKNEQGETTWGGLAEEVRYWGNWVLKKVKAEIGDLYPLIPDPRFKGKRELDKALLQNRAEDVPPGYLIPVAYLWTRTVTCKKPTCRATVPLLKQTWLCKKKDATSH